MKKFIFIFSFLFVSFTQAQPTQTGPDSPTISRQNTEYNDFSDAIDSLNLKISKSWNSCGVKIGNESPEGYLQTLNISSLLKSHYQNLLQDSKNCEEDDP